MCCQYHQNVQGGDITDDGLPKAELWWAGRGAEAEGEKSFDLILEPVLDSHFKKDNCQLFGFFLYRFFPFSLPGFILSQLSNNFTRWVAGA